MRLRLATAATFFSAIFLAVMVYPSVASAGDCPGMLDYTYEAGECTDKTGDTTDVLIRAGNEAESLQQGIISRSQETRISSGGFSGNRRSRGSGISRKLYVSVGLHLYVHYNGPALLPPIIANHLQAKSKAERNELKTMLYEEIYSYDHNADVRKAYDDPTYLVGAREYFEEAAYLVALGQHVPEDGTRRLIVSHLNQAMVFGPLPAQTESTKELLRERYIVTGTSLLLGAGYARRHHDSALAAQMRTTAYRALRSDMQIDPATLPYADLPCVAQPQLLPPINWTCDQWKSVQLHGHR